MAVVSVHLPDEIHARLIVIADEEGITASSLVQQAAEAIRTSTVM